MPSLVAAEAAFLAAFAAMEATWLSLPAAKRMYSENFAAVQGGRRMPLLANPWAAAGCYAVLLAAAWVLVVRPAAESPRPALAALWRGLALAAASYGVYNLTNLATLHGYSVRVALVDTAWGAAVLVLPALAAVWAARAF